MDRLKTERNDFVDIMRGLAMLLVVLGHTMTGCTTGSEDSFLFNVIWSLQMPLFILISGYVTRYSRPIDNGIGLLKFIARKSLAYLVPWLVWSFVVRGVLLGQTSFLNISWLLWHMDSGYWFLATIWTISMVFGICAYLSDIIGKGSKIKSVVLLLVLCVFCMALLFGIGALVGFSFFAIKLTLYYMPFYFAGHLYGQFRDSFISRDSGKTVIRFITVVCLFAWLYVLLRYKLYHLNDSGVSVALRAVTSLAGCITVCSVGKGLFETSRLNLIKRVFQWCGVHSLEIYLVHCLLLIPLKLTTIVEASSVSGVGLIFTNFLITISLSAFVVFALTSNKPLKVILFGYKK